VLLGLEDSGYITEARTAASALLDSCAAGVTDSRGKGVTAGAFYSPAACAALLALAGSLQ
jgi:hypothetical protein